jgi:hypothetical protein
VSRLFIKAIHRLCKDRVFTDHLLYLIPRMTTEADKVKYIVAVTVFTYEWRPETIIKTGRIRKAIRVGKFKNNKHEKVFD